MDALSALVADLLMWLRAVVAPEFCPGEWAWAATLLGVAMGLVPALGALVGAWSRRSGVAAVAGLVAAGLVPLLVITATGQAFTEAARAGRSAGLPGLRASRCFDVSQADYLTGTTVGEAFDTSRPLLLTAAVFAFGLFPLLVAVFVALTCRMALRGAPRWPGRLFWVPILVLPGLTAAAPAGSSGHLWLGATAGALAGIPVVLAVRPSGRSAASRARGAPPAGGARPGPPRPVPQLIPQPTGQPTGNPFRPASPSPTPPQRLAAAAAAFRARSGPAARALAERFAARQPVPPLVLPPERLASPTPPPGGPRPPTLVLPEQRGAPARFQVISRLGAGGFGRVWLAHDNRLGHTVALKAALVPDAETEERIRREARALATVRHENCVHIHDLVHAGSDPGLVGLSGLVIVMEYVDGASLLELAQDSRSLLDDIRAARIWAGLADGLDTAHRHGVLHRDVKPANVVLDAAGVAHLIDFGIARRAGDSTLTLAGFVLGTPDFLAPEVAGGGAATPASDAWQLAATISFAMTGYPPRGEFPDAVSGLRAAAVGAPVTHLPARSAHTALLQAALAADPAARPSLAQTHAALVTWLRHTGTPLTGSTRA